MDYGQLLLSEWDLNPSEDLELRLLQGCLDVGEKFSLHLFFLIIFTVTAISLHLPLLLSLFLCPCCFLCILRHIWAWVVAVIY